MARESWDVISFGGEETLVLAKFAQEIIKNLADIAPYIVHIEGRYVTDNSPASVLGKLIILNNSDEYISGYIRNIRVEDIYEQNQEKRRKGLSVGCSNATLEDIAADKVSFFFFGKPGGRQALIRDRHYIYYAVRPFKKCTTKDMKRSHGSNEYLKAIAVAKRMGNDSAEKLLITYLERTDTAFDSTKKEMTAEAFRSLEKRCQKKPKCSQQATDALIGYIESKYLNQDYRNSVIYSIEALGFVANHNMVQKVKVFQYLSALLSSCQRDNFSDKPEMYWHVVWASLVTLTRTMPNTLTRKMQDNLVTVSISAINKSLLDSSVLAKIEPEEAQRFISPIIEINKSLLDRKVLAEIKPEETQSVIQTVLAEVIIKSGIIPLEVYLSLFGLNSFDLNNIQTAGREDNFNETNIFGDSLKSLIDKITPKLINEAGTLTRAMATAIVVGLVRSLLHLP